MRRIYLIDAADGAFYRKRLSRRQRVHVGPRPFAVNKPGRRSHDSRGGSYFGVPNRLRPAGAAQGADRPAKQILDDIKAIKKPVTEADTKASGEKKAQLIGELLKAYPKNDQLPRLLPERWLAMGEMGQADEALAEIEKILPTAKTQAFKVEGAYAKAKLMASSNNDKAVDAAQSFAKLAPFDRRAAGLLYAASQSLKDEDPQKAKIEEKILKDFANTDTAKAIKAERAESADGPKDDRMGKPFELEFEEAIKGGKVSMKDLKGKVVVIDFWATWCGPCVGEIPNMKKIYAEYKDKGVEFIGVSLDAPKAQGGLEKLTAFVKEKEVTWPQYYVDKDNFASKWGINAIPTVFIIDADGNLYSMKARGKLETLIPKLLKKGKTSPSA